jgi:ankyrin repeat protein
MDTINNFFSRLFTHKHSPTQAELNTQLLDAVSCNDTAPISALITAGADVNTATHYTTTLMWAASRGHKAIVRALLAAPGIQVNANIRGKTALMYAAQQGHTDIVSALLAVPNIQVNTMRLRGKTALIIAARNGHIAIVRCLLAIPGILVNQKAGSTDYTALIAAVGGHHTEIVTDLLAAPGILINQVDRFGDSALMLAVRYWRTGRTTILRALLAAPGIDVNLANRNGRTAIVQAFEDGRHDMVTLLQARGAVLPAHLRQGNRAGNNINGNQSVHEVSVHLSVSRSAKNLVDQYLYTQEQVIHTINELAAWLDTSFANPAELPREYKPEYVDPAKRCVARLNSLDFTDQRSNVTMQQTLALVWTGMNNPQARGADKPTLEAQEIINRCISFLKHLYEIQRGYNFVGNSANPVDNGLDDKPTCVSGSFNKLIGALSDAGHQGVQIIFVTPALINMQVPFLTKQAFGTLSEEHRKRFSQSWENENSEALQAECFGLLKDLVSTKLHEIYDELHAEVPNLNQIITDSAANVQHTDMDTVMNQEREMIQKKELAEQAERERQAAAVALASMPTVHQQRVAVVFSCDTRGVKRSRAAEAVNAPEPEEAAGFAPVGRYPKRSTRSFRGSYKA